MPKKSGFTLIELLITMTVIAVLSVIGLTTYNGVQARARDTKRIEDLKVITNYLELYYKRFGKYPVAGTDYTPDNSTRCGIGTPWVSGRALGSPFLNEALVDTGISDRLIPVEKFPITENACSYRYGRWPDVCGLGKTYAVLYADLETNSGKEDDRPPCFDSIGGADNISKPNTEQDKKDWAIFLPE